MAARRCVGLAECSACPRLVALRHEVRDRHPDHHAAPVPAWGAAAARLLIVGLAPGRHGANRTGRPFTGDASGRFLFAALHRAGFASSADADRASLRGIRITNAVKCLPPGNRPLAAEIRNCGGFLADELTTLQGRGCPRRPRAVLCLGRLAHDATLQAARTVGLLRAAKGSAFLPDGGAFRHGQRVQLAPKLHLFDTYHPSRQNTNTGRLTETMLDRVLVDVRELLRGSMSSAA